MARGVSEAKAGRDRTFAWNFRELARHGLMGHSAVGEGMSLQLAPDGRRILWLAHAGGPKSHSAVDVSEPREPRLVCQADLPHSQVRASSLEVAGNLLVVGYECERAGMKPAGFDLFDVSQPERARLVSHFDRSGAHSRGVTSVWFVDGEYVHIASGAEDFRPRDARDDQCYSIVDVRDPARPREAGRWWVPGTREGDAEASPRRVEGALEIGRTGFRARNAIVLPERPDRAYLACLDYGSVILDISDFSRPESVGRWSNCPPYAGYTHTALPLPARNLMLVSDATAEDAAQDWPRLVWLLEIRAEDNPMPMSTLPIPPKDAFAKRGGRYGANNLHRNRPVPGAWRSDSIVFGTFFNGGLRAFDIANAHRAEEIAYYVPGAPEGSPAGAVQLDGVYADDRGIVYTADRHTGGLYIVEAAF